MEYANKIRNRGTGVRKVPNEISPAEYRDPVPIDLRRGRRRRRRLTLAEKHQIVHQVVCQLLSQTDVAQEHRVSVTCVSLLVKKARKNPRYLSDLAADAEK